MDLGERKELGLQDSMMKDVLGVKENTGIVVRGERLNLWLGQFWKDWAVHWNGKQRRGTF